MEGSEFGRRRLGGVEQGGDRTVDRLGIAHALQAVLDDAHPPAIALVPAVLFRGIDAVHIRAIGQRLFRYVGG